MNLFKIISPLIVMGAFTLVSDAKDLQLEGTFEILMGPKLQKTQEGAKKITGNFTMVVTSNCLWKVDWKQSDESFDFQEMGTDGEKVFTLRSVEAMNKAKADAGKKVGVNSSVAIIEPGNFPNPGQSHLIPFLWWGFASSCHLNASNNTQVPAISHPDLMFAIPLHYAGVQLPATVTRHKVTPHLPTSVVFMDDGKRRSWPDIEAGLSGAVPMKIENRTAPYFGGFTNTILTAGAFTNASGSHIPTIVEAHVFGPRSGAVSNTELDLWRIYKITVSKVQTLAEKPNTVPTPKGKIFMADHRFVSSQPRVYSVGYLADDKWLTDAEVKDSQAYKKRAVSVENEKRSTVVTLARKERITEKRPVAKYMFIGLVVLSAGGALFFLKRKK